MCAIDKNTTWWPLQDMPQTTNVLNVECNCVSFSVTRWLDYLFNIWPFTTICPTTKRAKVGSNLSNNKKSQSRFKFVLNSWKPPKIAQNVIFCQSGKVAKPGPTDFIRCGCDVCPSMFMVCSFKWQYVTVTNLSSLLHIRGFDKVGHGAI